jgi:hypothetical protein
MLEQRTATFLQRAIPMAAGIIGVACCLLALNGMRAQQADDQPQPSHTVDTIAGRQLPHHMRGWQLHRSSTNSTFQRVGWTPPGLS